MIGMKRFISAPVYVCVFFSPLTTADPRVTPLFSLRAVRVQNEP